MKKRMDGILRRYGTAATLRTGAGERSVHVFFHSVNSSSWQNMERVFAPLGEVPRGQYICVLPADAAAAPEDTLVVSGREYLLRKVERMDLFTGPMYCWALCVEKGGEDSWACNG